jgi:hypothetical protein
MSESSPPGSAEDSHRQREFGSSTPELSTSEGMENSGRQEHVPAAAPAVVTFHFRGCWSLPLLLAFPLWGFRWSPLRRPVRAVTGRVALWQHRRIVARLSKHGSGGGSP